MRYFDQLLAKLETLRSKYRTPQEPAPAATGRFRPRAELLEDRVVPSTIQWVNRGAIVDLNGDGDFRDDNEDRDGFNDVFGTAQIDADGDGNTDGRAADLARRVIDAVIDSWERVIVDFNYSDGTNTFLLTVNMKTIGSGFSAVAGPDATDPITGGPTAGSMSISRGFDGPDSNADWVDMDGDGTNDPRGDGIGWFLDPTPNDNSEFLGGIVNAYTGNPQAGSPAISTVDLNGDGTVDQFADLFTPVAHELCHALGFLKTPQLVALSSSASQFDVSDGGPVDSADPDKIPEAPLAGLWVFNGPTIQHVLTAYNSGNPPGDVGGPTHSAPAGSDAFMLDSAGNLVTYRGATDLMTPFYSTQQRKLVPYTAALILKDAYGFTVRNPDRFGTFYASLNETTGELVIRGGSGVSDDVITVSVDGSELIVEVDIGNDVPGTGRFPGDENLPAFESRFPRLSVKSVRIEAGGGDDVIFIDEVEVPTFAGTAIDGASGNDRYIVGGGDYLANIHGDVTINGDGDDELTIDDSKALTGVGALGQLVEDEYTIRARTFDKSTMVTFFGIQTFNSPTLTFDSIADVTLNASGSIGEDLAPDRPLSTIKILGVALGTELTVYGNAGDDKFIIGNGKYDSNILGAVAVDGGDGEDQLHIDDSVGDGVLIREDHRLSTNTDAPWLGQYVKYWGTPGFFESETLSFRDVQSVELLANQYDNEIVVDATISDATYTLNGNGGNDDFIVGGGDYLANIHGELTINGGDEDNGNELTIDDRLAEAGITFDRSRGERFIKDAYQFDDDFFEKRTTITPSPIGLGTVVGPRLTFNSLSQVELLASTTTGTEFIDDVSTTVTIDGVAAGTSLSVNGNGGNDTFVIGGGHYMDIRGAVTVDGGDGENHLQIDDSINDLGFLDHRFSTSSDDPSLGQYVLFVNVAPFRERETLSFRGVQSVELLANDFSNDIFVDATIPDATYTLNGNGGNDEIVVNAAALGATVIADGGEGIDTFRVNHVPEGNIEVVGGLPDRGDVVGRGDRLFVDTMIPVDDPRPNGEYGPDPNDSTGGDIFISGRKAIDFTGLEPVTVANFNQFTLVSARSHDDIVIDSPEPDRSRIDGDSDGMGFENLTFLDVSEVILDLARNDAADADDRVVIQRDSLSARGLEKLTILVGKGQADVTILDSAVPVTVISEETTVHHLVVTNSNDSGPGSLREAIEAANAETGDAAAVIAFAIPDTDPNFVDVDSHLAGGDAEPDAFVLSPLSALPALTRGNIVINGQSQQNATGDTNPFGPEIVIAGNLAGTGANGLVLESSGNLVHGLNVQQFSGDGILVTGDDNALTGNYVGTAAAGDVAAANGVGVIIDNTSGNWIGGAEPGAGNVISGNRDNGVRIIGPQAAGNHVAGNNIGLAADGLTPLGNGISTSGVGVLVQGTPQGNVIGGATEAERNVISGNGWYNVHIAGTQGTTVQGNFIGTDSTGTQIVPVRARNDVRIEQDRDSLIGGTESGAGNVLVGSEIGIFLVSGAEGTRIQGNRIGTSADGQEGRANIWGIYVDGFVNTNGVVSEVTDVEIGGTQPGAGNLISGNQVAGVKVFGPGSQEIVIQGNKIGTNIDGDGAIGNGTGISIQNASGVVVGGSEANAGNLISGNGGSGVSVLGSSVGNTIRGNSISSNGGLGIDLGIAGANPNDDGDVDAGPNDLQNSPVLTSAAVGKSTRVAGQLRSTPNSTFTIDFYATAAADSSGYGEGERWLGSLTVTTDDLGVAGFSTEVANAIAGEFITATATNSNGSTSEFSNARAVRGHAVRDGGRPSLLADASAGDSLSGSTLTLDQVKPLLAEAADYWHASAGSYQVRIADLPGSTLGLAAGNTIWLDVNAAGRGWYVDPTPSDDLEFTTAGDQGEQNRMDLLSVLIHEMGHLLGHDHDHDEGGVMSETLDANERLTLSGVFLDY